MLSFDSCEPQFTAGQCLTAEQLNRLRDYLARLGSILLEGCSDGILHGLKLQTDSGNGLLLSAGAFKLHGRIGFLETPLPLPVDFVESRTLVLQEGDARAEMAPSHISTALPEIVTGIITSYTLTWQALDYPDVPSDGLELGRVRAISGQSYRNFALDTGSKPDQFPAILKGRRFLNAGDICRLYVPHSSKGRWPTLGPEVQQALADWLLDHESAAGRHLTPSLLRGELPLCDYTRTDNVYQAAAELMRLLNQERHVASTAPVEERRPGGAIRLR